MSGRLRGQSGFGLIELLMAMVMLNIGLLAVVAAFTSGIWGLARAASISTAASLGDRQMELYRELPNGCIYVSSPPSSGTYSTDSAYSASYQVTSGVGAPPSPAQCQLVTLPTNALSANRTSVAGSDHHNYEVDTYVNYRCSDLSTPTGAGAGTCGSATGGRETLVVVVVRDQRTLKVLNRQSSMFDPSNDYR